MACSNHESAQACARSSSGSDTAPAADGVKWKDERAFAKLILPIMASNVFLQLYAPVNTAVLGRFRSTEEVAVIGACSFLSMMQEFVFGGLATGFGIYLCECAGRSSAEENKGCISSLRMGWTAAMALAGVLTLAGVMLACTSPLLLELLNVPGDLHAMAAIYAAVLLSGSGPLVIRRLMLWLLQAGKMTGKSSAISAGGVLMQTFLSLFMVGLLHLPVWASALAAVLNNLLMAGISWIIIRRSLTEKESNGVNIWRPCRLREVTRDVWSDLLRGGLSKSAMKILTGLGGLPKQMVLNACTVEQIAGHTIAMTISNIPQVILGSYGTCAAILFGQWHGAGRRDLLQREAKRLFSHAAAAGLMLTVLMLAGGSGMIRLIAGGDADGETVAAGYLTLTLSSAGFTGLAVYCVGHFGLQGIGRYKVQLYFGLLSMAVQILTVCIAAPVLGFAALPVTTMMSWLLPGILALYAWRSCMKNQSL